MSEVLRFTDVSLRRGPSVLLENVSLSIQDGERWVILGPNGAGKTTFLEIASGRLHPTEGSVDILGEQLGRVDVFELRPRIGYASAALAANIPRAEKVRDIVLTAAYGVLGRWNEQYEDLDVERADALLWAFGITQLADRTFGTLSEGEKKRVQIARSLMTDPEVLLLDEPAAGLDLGGREELMRALSEIMQSPEAPVIVMVTHHVEEIPVGMSHALLMGDGGVVAAGPIGEVLNADNLSKTFGIPITVTEEDRRFHAKAS